MKNWKDVQDAILEACKKIWFIYIVWAVFGVGALNFFVFGNDYGNMSNLLVYDNELILSELSPKLVNLGICAVAAAILIFAVIKWPKVVRAISTVLILTCVGLSVVSVFDIKKSTAVVEEKDVTFAESGEKIIHLSKTGKNVVFVMLDRAMNEYVPMILEEKPELRESLDGFTYYPNTVSFGTTTNFSTPSLFGGYDYTPEEINKRDTELLADKQNEAMSVLPQIFNDKDYDITIMDAPYVGTYEEVPDLSLYDKYENARSYYTEGAYSDEFNSGDEEKNEKIREHNFVYHSIFRMAPSLFKVRIYDNGKYFSTIPDSGRIFELLIDSYSTLVKLPEITDSSTEKNTFVMMQNGTTHQPAIFKTPEYVPEKGLTTEYNADGMYMVNMAAIQMCKWFDYLKEEGVYDNTRIILCADHGFWIGGKWQNGEEGPCVSRFNPLLLVKDFNAKGFNTDDEFMTLADVPSLVTKDVIDNPVNPFTGNAIDMSGKEGGVNVTASTLWDTRTNNKEVFDTSDEPWYHIDKNIFDMNNWEIIRR